MIKKVFYRKSCNWWFQDRYFKSFNEAKCFVDGYNLALSTNYSFTQKEVVKIFAYSYSPEENKLRVTQSMWRYEGKPCTTTLWTKQLRKSHWNTVMTRLEKDNKHVSFVVYPSEWEESLTMNGGREKFIENMYYDYFFCKQEENEYCDSDSEHNSASNKQNENCFDEDGNEDENEDNCITKL